MQCFRVEDSVLRCSRVAGFRLFVPVLELLKVEVFRSIDSGSAIGDDRMRDFVNGV